MTRRRLTATQTLHAHIRKCLDGQTEHVITEAIAAADAVYLDGAGHMQSALDTAIAHATQSQQAAA